MTGYSEHTKFFQLNSYIENVWKSPLFGYAMLFLIKLQEFFLSVTNGAFYCQSKKLLFKE